MDPLRWQVNFGIGAAQRVRDRLVAQQQAEADAAGTALVLHHRSEVNDFIEDKYGRRYDGQQTRAQQESIARYEQMLAERDASKSADKINLSLEEFYAKYPDEDPKVQAEREAEWAKERKRLERNAARRTGRRGRQVDWHKEEQAGDARSAGRKAGDRVNLTPFVEGPKNGSNTRLS